MKFILLLTLFSFIFCTSPKKQEVERIVNEKELVEEVEVAEIAEPKSYEALKTETLAKRAEFKKKYDTAKGNAEEQEKIIQEAQIYLINTTDEYFKAWYGTPWDFNGHTKIPRKGKIACGYLVTTILKDMGFNIPRIKWAQQASAYIVEQTSTEIKKFHNQSMDVVNKHLENSGEGLYIVGLDTHVGFIYYKDEKMSFVHSNYYRPETGVMAEKLVGWNPLNHSKYRIIGKIFQKEMVQNWIHNTAYPV